MNLNLPELQLIHRDRVLIEVLLERKPVHFSQRERSLLSSLAREPGKIVLQDVLRDEHGLDDQELYNQIYRLRRKLGRLLIEQVGGRRGLGPGAGSGYRLAGVHVSWIEVRAS